MGPKARNGVAAYLEAFLLIGVAVGGSGLVLAAGAGLVRSGSGPALSLSGASVRLGRYFAIESVLVYNSGSVPADSFVVSTTGVSEGASYCYSVYDPLRHSAVASTCPTMTPGPSSVELAVGLAPGEGVLVVLTVAGSGWVPGSVARITVTMSSGAQGTIDAGVVPA